MIKRCANCNDILNETNKPHFPVPRMPNEKECKIWCGPCRWGEK